MFKDFRMLQVMWRKDDEKDIHLSIKRLI